MAGMYFPFHRRSLIVRLIFGLIAFRTAAQNAREAFLQPPTSFSAEDDKFPDAVPVPDCARRMLARDRDVVSVLDYEKLSPEQLPADWFTASEQSLGEGKGTYLVVMGAGLMRGANINPFWIFRGKANSCELLLNVGVHDLEILKTRTNGLPDVKVSAATAVRYSETQYGFDGHVYQVAKRESQPIGEEIPHDLSGFETREPLVQVVGQNPNPILYKARAWLWRQWWLEKPSYLRITLHSKEGGEIATTYFIRRAGTDLQAVIQTHRILASRIPNSRHAIVEDEIVVAADVERWLISKNVPTGAQLCLKAKQRRRVLTSCILMMMRGTP